eukprot:CAMPEP_0118836240 /NCGR_PEP_ID=MMETSP1162-20130426/57764_1 /TAXON_ID=33656 /ORGANISM="Phaeocystis Sp, Strain CCMP2710" /LENGTH=48 /DNA_ID= /DNA_START= /DNA_END= /DNA_ORIENTATION=
MKTWAPTARLSLQPLTTFSIVATTPSEASSSSSLSLSLSSSSSSSSSS